MERQNIRFLRYESGSKSTFSVCYSINNVFYSKLSIRSIEEPLRTLLGLLLQVTKAEIRLHIKCSIFKVGIIRTHLKINAIMSNRIALTQKPKVSRFRSSTTYIHLQALLRQLERQVQDTVR